MMRLCLLHGLLAHVFLMGLNVQGLSRLRFGPFIVRFETLSHFPVDLMETLLAKVLEHQACPSALRLLGSLSLVLCRPRGIQFAEFHAV